MKQANLGLNLSSKLTRKREFLDEMNHVVPWAALVALILPYYPAGQLGRRPFSLETMLRIHFMQQWFGLSDPAMEEALFDVPLYREFAQLDSWTSRLPDESTILRFRHRLEKNKLAEQILAVVNAPSSTKNAKGERDPEMHQTQKGQQWYFGMKAHIGVDADSGLVYSIRGTAANVNDVVEGNSLLHGQETDTFGDAGYRCIAKRPDTKATLNWHVAMLYSKRQFGYVKVRYRGLKKNTAQITTLFALSNLWMARHKLMAAQGDSSAWTGSWTDCMGQTIQDLVDG